MFKIPDDWAIFTNVTAYKVENKEQKKENREKEKHKHFGSH